jgi:hypothetical protein
MKTEIYGLFVLGRIILCLGVIESGVSLLRFYRHIDLLNGENKQGSDKKVCRILIFDPGVWERILVLSLEALGLIIWLLFCLPQVYSHTVNAGHSCQNALI